MSVRNTPRSKLPGHRSDFTLLFFQKHYPILLLEGAQAEPAFQARMGVKA